jgi:hypothetical protein
MRPRFSQFLTAGDECEILQFLWCVCKGAVMAMCAWPKTAQCSQVTAGLSGKGVAGGYGFLMLSCISVLQRLTAECC